MMTLSETIDLHGIDVLDHLDRSVEIPVLAGVQMQGDVAVIPAALTSVTVSGAMEATPQGGRVLVEGMHDHTLLGGRVSTSVQDPEGLAVAVVESDEVMHLAHVEHGYLALAPGRYVVRRQREQAEVARLVAD